MTIRATTFKGRAALAPGRRRLAVKAGVWLAVLLLLTGCDFGPRTGGEVPPGTRGYGFGGLGEEVREQIEGVRESKPERLIGELTELLDRWKQLSKEELHRNEALLHGYLGIAEQRGFMDQIRLLDEFEILERIGPVQNCWLIWQLLGSGLSVSSQALADCQNHYDQHALRDGLELPVLEGDSSMTPIVLTVPAGNLPLVHFSNDVGYHPNIVGALPEASVRWYPAPNHGAIVIDNIAPRLKSVAKWARSKSFDVTLRRCVDAGGQTTSCSGSFASEETDRYRVRLPVLLGIHAQKDHHGASLVWDVAVGEGVDEVLFASGDEIATGGPMQWSWQGDPLPDGLLGPSVLTASSGHPPGTAGFSGNMNQGARSARGQIKLTQGAGAVSRDAELHVPVHFDPVERAWLDPVFELHWGDAFDQPLPQPMGGDGTSYTWTVNRGQSALAALGLQLDVGTTGNARIHGTVSVGAPLGSGEVGLTVSSTMGHPAYLSLRFELTAPFSIWDQNAQLRPNNLFRLSSGEVAALSVFFPSIGAAEIVYDIAVPNTFDDNAERTDLILGRHEVFDIVALQEVLDEDNRVQLLAGTTYQEAFGPPGPDAKFNPFDPALPEADSGLVLLVNQRLDVVESEHRTHVFTACKGDLLDVIGGIVTFNQLNSDCLAQKGFSIDKIRFGTNPDAYIWMVNTHLDSGGGADDRAARAAQFVELRDAILGLQDPAHPVLLTGDFNVVGDDADGTTEWSDMLGILGVTDLYRKHFPSSASKPGYTYDNQINAYAYHWDNGGGSPHRNRIDYLFVRQGKQSRYLIELDTSSSRSIVVQDNLRLPNRAYRFETSKCRDPGPPVSGWTVSNARLRCYLSDHWGLEARLKLVRSP